jgi:hypothetical protein
MTRHTSNTVRAYRFARRNPVPTFILLVAILVGIAANHWLSISFAAQGLISTSLFAVLMTAYVVRRLDYGAIYVVKGLHPLTGVLTTIYVGLTTQKPYTDRDGIQRWPRIEQHLFGSDYYGSKAKPWADTVVTWGFADESYRFLLSVLKRREVKWIHRLIPLYNRQWNLDNPHRIDGATAKYQRAQRNAGQYTPEYYQSMIKYEPLLARKR